MNHQEPRRESSSVIRPVATQGLRNVVVVAGTGSAHPALERAALLSLAPDARVAILMKHGEDRSAPLGARLGPSGERLAARLQSAGGHLSVINLSRDEDTVAAIEHHGMQQHPELIILGREPQGLFARLLGATPEKLARHCHVPVLVTQRPAEHPYRRIMAGIDFSEFSHRVLEMALRLKEPSAEAVEVIHCYDASYALVLHQTGASSEQVVAYYGKRHAQAENALRDFLKPSLQAGANLRLQVRSGDPRVDLDEAVREQEIELLVVGRSARHGLGELLVGSIADACLKRAECDVLIVPQSGPTWH